jgi:hypothetical protein
LNSAVVSITQRPNSEPEFPSSEDGARSVDENTPTNRSIGTPVAATDADNDSLDGFCATVGDARRRAESTVGELADAEPLLDLPSVPYPAEGATVRKVAAERSGVGVGQPLFGSASGDRNRSYGSLASW